MPPTPSNTRGIIAPVEFARHVELMRYPAPAELVGLIDWFWSVRWRLPMGFTHRQHLVAEPGVNLSVGVAPPPGIEPPPGPYPLRAVVNGVTTERTTRAVTGHGWNLAAKSTTGGFGAWVDDVRSITDTVVPASAVLTIPAKAMLPEFAGQPDTADLAGHVATLAEQLTGALRGRPPERVETARWVASLAAAAEQDRQIKRVDDLAQLAGRPPRTLQRLFAEFAGVSPGWVIRRLRLIEAAELVREGAHVDWSQVAVELGYSDQPHLTRDFTRTIGVPPATYARQQRLQATD